VIACHERPSGDRYNRATLRSTKMRSPGDPQSDGGPREDRQLAPRRSIAGFYWDSRISAFWPALCRKMIVCDASNLAFPNSRFNLPVVGSARDAYQPQRVRCWAGQVPGQAPGPIIKLDRTVHASARVF
jgi:hypothetical protein